MLDASTSSPPDSSALRGAAVLALVRAASRLRREHEALCQTHGLTGQQFNVLRILRGAARGGEGHLPTMTVGERMVEPEPGITRLMGRLEAKGFVARQRCPADARTVRCALTPAGAATLDALDAPLATLHAHALGGLSDADVSTLSGLLARALSPTPMSHFPTLLAPATWGDLALQNHVVMSPMTRSRALGGAPNEMMAEYYGQRATAGLIVTEGTSPSPNGLGYARIPGLYTDEQAAGWRLVTDAVHARGGKIVVQLMHTGRIAHSLNLPAGAEVLAPSAVQAGGEMWTDQEQMQPHPTPRAMTTAEVEAAVAEHGTAARLALSAGFDGVEVHGANGYLVEQFLSPNTNQRTDRYGGSVENRARFAVEVAEAVAAEVGAARTGIRLSPHGLAGDMAPTDGVAEAYAHLAGEMERLGLGYLHVVDHSALGGAEVPDATVEAIRAAYTGTLILAGGYDAERAEADLASGRADLVAFGRPFISNPDLIARIAADEPLAEPDGATFYAPGPGGFADGYTDYPALAEAA